MSERIDDLQIKGYRLIQNPELFCFGIDAVLLSDFAKVRKGDSVIDLCTGNGIIPVLLAAKTEAFRIFGLEIQKESAELAKKSVELNNLSNLISIIQGDIKEAAEIFDAASFDVVTVNPPYMNENHGIINDYSPKAIARHELLCSLEDVIRESARLLKPGGNMFMIHRPHRLSDIMVLLREYHLEPKRIRFVHPYVDKEPSMVLIEANRGGKPNLRIDSPLIVYQDVNKYTEEIQRIYGSTGP